MTKHRLKTSPFWAIAVVAALGMGLTGCGSSGSDSAADDTPPVVETPNLTPFQSAAADAARVAAAAVMGQESNKDADLASYGAAQSAVSRAQSAAADAAAATTLAAATDARDAAVTARDEAVKYADMVRDEAAEDAAQMAAAQAAGDARTAAEAARSAANDVASIAGAEAGITEDANAAAEAANTAANAAEVASDNAQAADTLEDAVKYRNMAVAERNKAQGQQEVAEAELKNAREIAGIVDERNEKRDLMAARTATQKAADSVAEHLTAVQGKATDARMQASAARAAANRAKSARRDYANADKYATEAEADATAAEAALRRAQTADTNAKAALAAANTAETSADAEAEQAKAEAADGIAEEAHTGDTGAGMAYMAAKDAAMKAADYAGMNVLAILSALNAEDITAAAAKRTQLMALNTRLAAVAAETTNGNADAATTTTVIWRYAGGAGTDSDFATPGDNTAPGEGEVAITIAPTGGQVAMLMRDIPTTADVNEHNFVVGSGLGDFAEYHIAGAVASNTDADRTYTIVFTDKEQAAGPIAASTVTFLNRVPVATRLSAFTADGAGTMYDHDGDRRTPVIAVTVSCPTGATCDAVEDDDGNVTSITGYRISTATAGVNVAAVPEAEDDTYLAFGFWLRNDPDGTPQRTFGAFANAGAAVAPTAAPITGTAAYNGKAAGVHNTPSATNFFHADATLDANFGNATALGTITGRIHTIVSGGERVSDTIYLDRLPTDTNNIEADGTFDGRARMGAGVLHPQTGVVSYPYEGVWGGSFYNAAPAVPANQAPMSAAGTFGVTRADDASTPANETESFVGAFGAHR